METGAERRPCHHVEVAQEFCLAAGEAVLSAKKTWWRSVRRNLNQTKVMNQDDHLCPICTQSMGNEFWVCCRCYAYRHPGCIQITVVERRQPHQQGNRFSKQRLRHGRSVSRRTIEPMRPTSRIYQTYTINAKATSRYYSCSIRSWILSCLPLHVLPVQV